MLVHTKRQGHQTQLLEILGVGPVWDIDPSHVEFSFVRVQVCVTYPSDPLQRPLFFVAS